MTNKQLSTGAETTIKQALTHVGNRGIYQFIVIFIFSLAWVVITYGTMINSFVFMNPVFQCGDTTEPQKVACDKISQCRMINYYTASNYANLYCQHRSTRQFIQSAYSIGCLIGAFFFSIMSDYKGRRFSFLLSCQVGLICTYLLYYGIENNIVSLMVLGQLGNGIFVTSCSTLSYIVIGQIASNTLRQRAIMTYCAVWGVTQLTFLYIEDNFNKWNNYLLYMNLAPLLILFLLGFFYFEETPNFLFVNKGNLLKSQKNLTRMGKINRTSQAEIQKSLDIIRVYNQQAIASTPAHKDSITDTIREILANRDSIRKIICMSFLLMGFNIFYYGLLSSLERTGYSFGFNVFLIGIQEFLGYMVIGYFITKIKRIRGLFYVNIVSSLIGLIFILPDFIVNETVQSVLVCLCTIGFVATYSLTQMLGMESFDSKIRATSMGISSTISQIGRFFVPFVLTSMNDLGANPIIAVSFLFGMIAIPPLFFMQETYFPESDKKYEKVSTQFQI